MSALRRWGLSEQHLALDALVAFVDGELTPNAYDRAAAHIAGCATCRADAAAQRQARSAIRAADTPSMSPQFLRTLQSIPSETELPEQPDELALTEGGRLVTRDSRGAERTDAAQNSGPADPARGSSTRLGSGRSPLGGGTPIGGDGGDRVSEHPPQAKGHGRRTKQGASVVFSGLVLGALTFMNVPAEDSHGTMTTVPRPFPRGDTPHDDAVVPVSTQAVTPSGPSATSPPPTGAVHVSAGPDVEPSSASAPVPPPAP
ncbi:putative zinc finger protein [Halopolyspora algeriensis]|uniref:Putative zinc finger protein n=1 Tax=Halopolyspora algeriensis TaxID=1500506 RepID=A0A368VPJ4_9ACTN|nr:zf-HC2 domain-containing protein [Halopolyspora algeriensis]RCW42792.1 putative zinc finger protein [Halopolyspora algeriensis]TQM56738.1 putative zinc finger protein [Halopolyspora algeriensis]